MVLGLTITVNDRVSAMLGKFLPNLEAENNRSLTTLSRFMRDRARLYSEEITGPTSQGSVTGKLINSLQFRAGKRKASVFVRPSLVSPRGVNYAVLQERGFGPIVGYHAVRMRDGSYRMRRGGMFPRVRGKRYMQRAAADGRLASRLVFREGVKTAIKKTGL